jgi:hypothetical protein
LAYTLTRVGLDCLGGRKLPWLAFRHGKDEYGIELRLLASSGLFFRESGNDLEDLSYTRCEVVLQPLQCEQVHGPNVAGL